MKKKNLLRKLSNLWEPQFAGVQSHTSEDTIPLPPTGEQKSTVARG